MDDDKKIRDLLLKTMCAGAFGIAAAEAFRYGFDRCIKRRLLLGSTFSFQVSDLIHSAVSAFILILTSYEKAVLLWSGMRVTFFILTFILCIVFSKIFASAAPSPFFPLIKHQKKIFLESTKPLRGKKPKYVWKSCLKMFAVYFHLAWPFLLGQFIGLLAAVRWMKVYWDGWLTSHHATYLPMLDECIRSLNTDAILGFTLETLITFFFLCSFDFIDHMRPLHDGANKIINSFWGKNGLKSAVIILSMYFFIDVTGSFANPFQALAMQRHCFDDVTEAARIIFVYVFGPFLGTVSYLLWCKNKTEFRDYKKTA